MSEQEFARYPEYGESEHEWLGDIPTHWDLKPVKYLCSFAGGSTPAKENRRYWDGGTVPWVSPKDMKVFWLSDTQDKITEAALEESSVSRVAPGALLMVVRSGILQRTIPVAMNTVSVTLNQDMRALTFSGPKGAEYFAYLVQGHVSALLQRWTKEGATVESVEHEFLANDSIPDVPTDERRAIVAFLDYETAKIDALIEKQQQLIALLKEKRQAVISHAVTKGLNPDAPMRDSGVEWLGEVPEHWSIEKAAWHFGAEKGRDAQMLTKEYCGDHDGPFPVYSGQTTDEGVMGRIDTFEFDVGNEGVLFSTTVGAKAMHVSHLFGRFSLSQNCLIVRPRSNAYFLRYAYFAFQVLFRFERLLIPDHMQASFRMEDFYQYRVVQPPREEQETIANHLDEQCDKFDLLIQRQEESVDLLQERRTALISAAVTGKIDVREWTPSDELAEVEVA